MSYPIKYPTPQGANIQIFNAGETNATQSWVKPQGASFVWFTLIGAGGGGAASDGSSFGGSGGSGAVTNCMVPAFLIPDVLTVLVGIGGAKGSVPGSGGGSNGTDGTASAIYYNGINGYLLLSANGGGQGIVGSYGSGGAASSSNYFSCMGFFQSIAGQSANSTLTNSSTTFLGGGTSTSGTNTVNYGYTNTSNGISQIQPIIVSSGGILNASGNGGNAGFGSGGGGTPISITAIGGNGGDGLVVIITW